MPRVTRGPVIDDRHRSKLAVTAVKTSGLICDTQTAHIRNRAARDEVAVDIIAADSRIEIEELFDADLTVVERSQAVLNANTVDGSQV